MDLIKKRFNTSPSMKKKSLELKKTFAIPLDELVRRDGTEIPLIVRRICDYLLNRGLDMEGIFRVNGNARIIENLRNAFDSSTDVNLSLYNDIYAVAGLLKLFLRELPEGLIPERCTLDFTEVLCSNSEDLPTCLDEFETLISSLPVENYNLLKYLCQFLQQIANNEFENKMSPISLGIVFGPNVFRCGRDFEGLRNQGTTNQIMCVFIEHCSTLFKMAAPRHSNIIQVKEYSRDHHKPVPSRPQPSKSDEGNSSESPRPKPRLSLQIPTANDVRHSSRVSDEDFRASSPFSMDTENEWSLVSPRVSVDISNNLQQAIRACVQEHLYGPSSEASTPRAVGPGPIGMSGPEEDTLSGSSDHQSPRHGRRAVNGDLEMEGKPAGNQMPVWSGNSAHHPSNNSVHEVVVVDDLDLYPEAYQAEKRQKTGNKRDTISSPHAGPSLQDATESRDTYVTDPTEETRSRTHPSRPKAVARRPRLAFQENNDPEMHAEGSDTVSGVPGLDLSILGPGGVDGRGHTEQDLATTPTGDFQMSMKQSLGHTHDDLTDTVRATTKRIQTLKRQIRQFEESFELEHGWKPGQAQKNAVEEVRQWMHQLSEARKELKLLKTGGGFSSLTLGPSHSKTQTGGTGSGPNSTRPLSAVSEMSATGAGPSFDVLTLPRTHQGRSSPLGRTDGGSMMRGMSSTLGRDQGSAPRVEDTYDMLVTRLADKRRQAGRPEALGDMTREQIDNEKLAIQKALLYFESVHGRPKDRHEKLVMKPLYDRYRLVKRLLQSEAGDSPTPLPSGERGFISDPDPPPRSTASSQQQKSVITIPTADFGRTVGTTDFSVTQDWGLLRGENNFFQMLPAHRAHTDQGRPERRQERRADKRLEDVNDMNANQLHEEQKAVKDEKRHLQKVLKDFEHEFETATGRKVEKEDRLPMRAEYNRYKQIKSRLKIVESQLSKKPSS